MNKLWVMGSPWVKWWCQGTILGHTPGMEFFQVKQWRQPGHHRPAERKPRGNAKVTQKLVSVSSTLTKEWVKFMFQIRPRVSGVKTWRPYLVRVLSHFAANFWSRQHIITGGGVSFIIKIRLTTHEWILYPRRFSIWVDFGWWNTHYSFEWGIGWVQGGAHR